MTDAAVDARLPGAQDEFETLHAKLRPLIERRQDFDGDGRQGEYVRVTLDVPAEWMWLAAWLTLKNDRRGRGDFGPVTVDLTHDDRLVRDQAKTFFARLIDLDMHMQLTDLANGVHPVLYPPEPKAAPALIEDEIPF